MGNIYFDVLDTDRTANRSLPNEIDRSNDAKRQGQAELKLAILRGFTPVFPQTYGWDSAALLDYASETGKEAGESQGAYFRSLVQKGFIRVRLFDQDSIWNAALNAFQSSTYKNFGAWPELGSENPEADKRAVVEFMKTDKCPSDIPKGVGDRLETLKLLSEAVKEAPVDKKETGRGDKLKSRIEAAAKAAYSVDPIVAKLLDLCTGLPENGANNRTAIDGFLEESKRRGELVPPEVREITNACFNLVAAESVSAPPALTVQVSSPQARQILIGAFPSLSSADFFEGNISPNGVNISDLGDVQPVEWSSVHNLLEKFKNNPHSEREKQAAIAGLIAKAAVDGRPRYLILTKVPYLHLLGAAVVPHVDAALRQGEITTAVFSGLAAVAGGLLIEETMKRVVPRKLNKKWLGLLGTH